MRSAAGLGLAVLVAISPSALAQVPGPPPPEKYVAMIRYRINFLRDEHVAHYDALIDQLKNALIGSAFKVPVVQSAIVPIIIGAEDEAVGLATRLRDRNIFVPAIRYPTVARGKARLRVTLTAEHTSEDIQQLVAALNENENPRR